VVNPLGCITVRIVVVCKSHAALMSVTRMSVCSMTANVSAASTNHRISKPGSRVAANHQSKSGHHNRGYAGQFMSPNPGEPEHDPDCSRSAESKLKQVESEIQRLMLDRLGIEWTPGEPFYSLIEAEIERLRLIRKKQRDRIVATDDENARLRAWAKDEQAKRHRCEDQRTDERSARSRSRAALQEIAAYA